MTLADVSQNRLCPLRIHNIVIRSPKQMVQMTFCDFSHKYHKQVTNVSPACFFHPTVGNFDVSPYPMQTIFHWLALGLVLGIIGSRWALLTHIEHNWLTLGLQGLLETNILILATLKSCFWGYCLTRTPNVSVFALYRNRVLKGTNRQISGQIGQNSLN